MTMRTVQHWLKATFAATGAAGLLWLTGCAAVPNTEEPGAPPPVRQGAGGTGSEGTSGGLSDPQNIPGQPLTDPAIQALTLVIYFDFDSSDIHPDDRIVVEAHAQYLEGRNDAKIVLEGHADERGSREYNVALGERRAAKVRDMLQVLGVSEDRIEVISFGEERPAMLGHDEESWGRNRRVEFVYLAR